MITYLERKLGAFLARQMKLSKCKKLGQRFSHADRTFSLSLYFCGPKAYSFCPQLFVLPSKRTLQLWLSKLNIAPDSVIQSLVSWRNSDNKDELLTLMAETRDVRRHWISTGSPDITTVIQRYPRLLDMNSAVSYLMALSDKQVAIGNKVT